MMRKETEPGFLVVVKTDFQTVNLLHCEHPERSLSNQWIGNLTRDLYDQVPRFLYGKICDNRNYTPIVMVYDPEVA